MPITRYDILYEGFFNPNERKGYVRLVSNRELHDIAQTAMNTFPISKPNGRFVIQFPDDPIGHNQKVSAIYSGARKAVNENLVLRLKSSKKPFDFSGYFSVQVSHR